MRCRSLPSLRSASSSGNLIFGAPVEVYEVTRGEIVQTVVASGRVMTPLRVSVSAVITERVVRIPVDEGQSVRLGDVLIVLDDRDERAAVAQSHATVDQGEAKLRQTRLFRSVRGKAIPDWAQEFAGSWAHWTAATACPIGIRRQRRLPPAKGPRAACYRHVSRERAPRADALPRRRHRAARHTRLRRDADPSCAFASTTSPCASSISCSARALVVFPGGYGTMDELFDTLALVQTRNIPPLPVVLAGKRYWRRVVDFDLLIDEEAIDPEDAELF